MCLPPCAGQVLAIEGPAQLKNQRILKSRHPLGSPTIESLSPAKLAAANENPS